MDLPDASALGTPPDETRLASAWSLLLCYLMFLAIVCFPITVLLLIVCCPCILTWLCCLVEKRRKEARADTSNV